MNAAQFKQFPLLKDLTEQDLEAVIEVLEEKSASAGAPLFREGSEAEGLVLITSGKVNLESRRTADTTSVGPGEALATVSLFGVGPHEVTAIAETRCEYLLLPRTSFYRLTDDAPRTASRLAEVVVNDLAGLVRESFDEMADPGSETSPTGES